ncbi:hypothetical protein ACVWZL_007366 [Bradyrhizobium sp. GM2.4]
MKCAALAIWVSALLLVHAASVSHAQQLYLTAEIKNGSFDGTPPQPKCPKGDVLLGVYTLDALVSDSVSSRYVVACSTPKAIQNDPTLQEPLALLREQIATLQSQVRAMQNNVKTLADSSDAVTKRLHSLEEQESSVGK